MPSINLRLSEEEHDALRKWAFDSRRSLQKEIVWRLFSGARLAEREEGQRSREKAVAPHNPVSADSSRSASPVVADAQPRDIPSRTVNPEFPGERVRGGPDPKPGQKR